jgi:very-short-patch-repair endonuclease
MKWIAFYHTAEIPSDKHVIRYYGEVSDCQVVSRRALFPEEQNQNKAHKQYYKIQISSLQTLEEPIRSYKPRRLLFVPTTAEKFFQYKDINYLFNDSPLEETLFWALKERNIPVERQWVHTVSNHKKYYLDFAIFCKLRNINIECDGNTYHDEPQKVHEDKHRNNELESNTWAVLRYTTEKITYHMEETMQHIYKTINNCGGYLDPATGQYQRIYDSSQLNLF